MERKTAAGWAFKAADSTRGATAVFARFDRGPDSDGDIYAPGAFTDGEAVIVSPWGHSSTGAEPPVGKGVVRAFGDRAEVETEFFDTTKGVETHRMLRELGDLAEWSYAFEVLDSEPSTWNGRPTRLLKRLTVHEVSPVARGAGVQTGTVAVSGPKNDDVLREYLRFVHLTQVLPAQHERAEMLAIREGIR